MTQLFSGLTSQLLGKSSLQQPTEHFHYSCNIDVTVMGLLLDLHSLVQQEASQQRVLSTAPAVLGEMKCTSHP